MPIGVDERGEVDIAELKQKAEENKDKCAQPPAPCTPASDFLSHFIHVPLCLSGSDVCVWGALGCAVHAIQAHPFCTKASLRSWGEPSARPRKRHVCDGWTITLWF